MARVGQMRERVSVQKSVETRSSDGGFIKTFSTEKTVWAKINPISGAERIDVDAVKAIRTHRITMRFYSLGLQPDDRLIHKGRAFNIVSVVDPGERGINTVLDVKEVVLVVDPSEKFIFQVKTDNTGTSTDFQMKLPLVSGLSYNFVINWGDGTKETITSDSPITHTYAKINTYTIDIIGLFAGMVFSNGGDSEKMVDVINFGNPVWRVAANAFFGCSNMAMTATDGPDTSLVTSFSQFFRDCSTMTIAPDFDTSLGTTVVSMFRDCSSLIGVGNYVFTNTTSTSFMFFGCVLFNGDVTSFDVGNISNFSSMFRGCTVFNRNLNGWNMSSATNLESMFSSCSTFNQNINSWDTSSVTDIEFIFSECSAFNQSLNSWDVSSVTNMDSAFSNCSLFNGDIKSWETSSVMSMNLMFRGCALFNQPINSWNTAAVTGMNSMFKSSFVFNQSLNSWDVSSVTNFNDMFELATLFNGDVSSWATTSATIFDSTFKDTAFDQDISGWDITNLTNASNMFAGTTMSTANLNALYVGWEGQVEPTGITFHGGNATHSGAGTTARGVLVATSSWTITDGGAA